MKKSIKLYLSVLIVIFAVVCESFVVELLNEHDGLTVIIGLCIMPFPLALVILVIHKIWTYKYKVVLPEENPEVPKSETGTKA